MIQSFKKLIAHPENADLLVSLNSQQANINDVTDFILHVIYNRPKREKTPGDRRYAMLFVGKGKKKKFASTKSLPPDQKSLDMKIMRADLISHSWANCLDPHYEQFDPCSYGWKFEDELLQPLWYHGYSLPTVTEIEEQLHVNSEEYRNPDHDGIGYDSDTSEDGENSCYNITSEEDNSSDSGY